MNLGACSALRTGAENAMWYRAIEPQHAATPLGSAHSLFISSRFNPATSSGATFPVLYLTENQVVALYEVDAIYGSASAGLFVPNPQASWLVMNVRVTLQRVADLTDMAEQAKLGTTAQELTGDWEGYLRRNALTPVRQPTGPAPT
jgi:RES domain-containing protein